MKNRKVGKHVLMTIAHKLRHYASGNSSYYVGARDAMIDLIDSLGYSHLDDCGALVIFDFDQCEVVRIPFVYSQGLK